MALTRSELKEIVKECILEVMLEGIRPNSKEPAHPMQENARRQPQQAPKRSHLDSVTFGSGPPKVANQAQGRKSVPVASDLVAEFPAEQRSVMQQMFEDTARTTLPSQLTAERSPASAMAQRADEMNGTAHVDPMSIFEGSSNWAELAFASSKK